MRKLGEAVIPFLDSVLGPGLVEDAVESSRLFRSWADIVEKNHFAAAAAHSRVREFEKNVLLIEADHPGWIQLLQTKQRKFLSDFQRRFPELGITGISFMLSKDGRIDDTPRAQETVTDKVETETDGMLPDDGTPAMSPEEALNRITDSRLKESLLRLSREVDERNHETGERA